jgi:hypothetical protein
MTEQKGILKSSGLKMAAAFFVSYPENAIFG